MNVFLWAGTVLVALLIPLMVFAFVVPRLDTLAALQAGGGIFTVALVTIAQGFHRSAYTILAIVAALLTFGGGMVFVRFFERELEP